MPATTLTRPELAPWEAPLYTAAAAGRLVGLTAPRVRRWLQGYEYSYPLRRVSEVKHTRQGPVVARRGQDPYASFLDLIDLLFIKKFLDRGISLQKLRKALVEADAILGGHHYAQRSFFTDGRNIYLQVHERDDAEALLQLLSRGQWVIAPIIKDVAEQIEFSDTSGFAERWYPLGKEKSVVVDPLICFGAPVVSGRGIETANVYDLFLAERKRPEPVASWTGLLQREVEDAVSFELKLKVA